MQSIHRSAVAAYQALTRLHLPAAFYSVQVVVPSLGESITDGTIASVLKGAGDQVKENETIAQIETDKVTIDIKAPSDGTILGIVVQEQETVVPGQLVATLDDAAAKVCFLQHHRRFKSCRYQQMRLILLIRNHICDCRSPVITFTCAKSSVYIS